MRKQLHKLPQKEHAMGGLFFVAFIAFFYAGITSAVLSFTQAIPIEKVLFSASGANTGVFGMPSGDVEILPPVTHVQTPAAVKAAYMSACVASTPTMRDRVINLINTTEINSIVLDIKDSTGMMSYHPDDPTLFGTTGGDCRIAHIRELIERLHKDNVYVIGRIAVFQDQYSVKQHPETAIKDRTTGGLWRDSGGKVWIDASSKDTWDYTVAIANDAYSQGFDEINFDYVRFPSDGKLSDMVLPLTGITQKSVVIKSFFEFLSNEMRTAGIITSADVFGMTTTSSDDLNIGQVLEVALANFDYVSPMVYPSHYPKGFGGWSNPNAHPYDLILFVMKAGVNRAIAVSTTPLKLRPWLQDFSLGAPSYGKREVEDQIQATYDSGLTSWMLWDPSNQYAGGALLRE